MFFRYTTLEGLLVSIKDDLADHPFFMGDSVESETKDKLAKLFVAFDEVRLTRISGLKAD